MVRVRTLQRALVPLYLLPFVLLTGKHSRRVICEDGLCLRALLGDVGSVNGIWLRRAYDSLDERVFA